jgi:hypothetical protein
MKTLFGTPFAEYLFPALIWLLALGFLLLAAGFSPMSREVPILVGWATLGLTTVDLFSRTRVRAAEALARWLNPGVRVADPKADKATSRPRLAMAVGGIVGFVAALVLAGVLCAVPVFLFVALFWGGKCRFATSVIIMALVTAFIWALFAGLLRLELYPGLLFGGDW